MTTKQGIIMKNYSFCRLVAVVGRKKKKKRFSSTAFNLRPFKELTTGNRKQAEQNALTIRTKTSDRIICIHKYYYSEYIIICMTNV